VALTRFGDLLRDDRNDIKTVNFSMSSVLAQVGVAIGVIAATGYVVANTASLHRGASGFGSCSTSDEVMQGVDLRGKIAIVTGASNGIGFETAVALARAGCSKVFLPCRSMDKATATVAAVSAKAGVAADKLVACVVDLGDLESVREFTRFVRRADDAIDILINNAGIMALPERTPTPQGYESQMATNHLAHHLIVKQLLPQLLRAKSGARVVFVSSIAHRLGQRAALQSDRLESTTYDPWTAYGNSKLANIVEARELQERFGASGVTFFSVHPGGIHSGLQVHVPLRTRLFWALVTPFFFKSISQGAATQLFCATNAAAIKHGGKYFADCNPATTSFEDVVNDAELRKKFFDTSDRLVAQYTDIDATLERIATIGLNKGVEKLFNAFK
jgi:NAD(P)-dependent dehydrogenase (short-subunit alcohol dehydrogenase family)